MSVVFLNSNQTYSEVVFIFGLVHLLQIACHVLSAVQEIRHEELQKLKMWGSFCSDGTHAEIAFFQFLHIENGCETQWNEAVNG